MDVLHQALSMLAISENASSNPSSSDVDTTPSPPFDPAPIAADVAADLERMALTR